jgi:hypothetical protein
MYEITQTHMSSPLHVHFMYYAYRMEHKTPCAWAYGWRTGPGASEMLRREGGHHTKMSLLRNACAFLLSAHSKSHPNRGFSNSLPLIYLSFRYEQEIVRDERK